MNAATEATSLDLQMTLSVAVTSTECAGLITGPTAVKGLNNFKYKSMEEKVAPSDVLYFA